MKIYLTLFSVLFINQNIMAAGVVVPNRCPPGYFLASARGGSACKLIPAETMPFGLPTQSSAHEQNYLNESSTTTTTTEKPKPKPKPNKPKDVADKSEDKSGVEGTDCADDTDCNGDSLLGGGVYEDGTITQSECNHRNGSTEAMDGEKICVIPTSDPKKSLSARIVDGDSSSSNPSKDKEKCSVDPASFTTVIESCHDDNSSAATRCNDKEDAQTFGLPGIGSSLNQVGQMVSGAMGGCGKMADMAKLASGGFAAFHAQCSQAISSCQESCSNVKTEIEKAIKEVEVKCKGSDDKITQQGDDVKNQLKEMKSDIADSARQCSDNQTNIALAQQNGQQLVMQLASSEQCKAQFSSVQNDICKVYPTLPACTANAVVDCNVAANASKIDCICKVNPGDPLCPGGNQKLGSGGGFKSGAGASDLASLNNKKPDLSGGSDVSSLSDGGMQFDPNGMGGKSASRSGGVPEGRGGGLGGGAGGKGGGGDPQGRAGSEDVGSKNGNISYGRGGGGGGMYGYGSGSSDGNEKEKSAEGTRASMNGPNFKKWLPGQVNDPKRNIAGVVGPDGITCATCGSIFDKVGLRYQKVKSSLQPD
jgi:hypothetical protein